MKQARYKEPLPLAVIEAARAGDAGAVEQVLQYLKREWAFFLDERGRMKYNELCRKCERSCKQSFRATVIQCPHYLSKRRTRQ